MLRRKKRIPVFRPDIHGAAPGVLNAPLDALPSQLSLLAYSRETLIEETDITLARLEELRGQHAVLWVNLEGLADIDLLRELGEKFNLHRLALEDTLNIPQRPKCDDYGHHQYIVARMPVSKEALETEQVSIFLGDGFLLTFQERPSDCFVSIQNHLRDGNPRIREGGADYLAYALVDAIIDSYFPLLESTALRLDELELEVIGNPEKKAISEIHDLKRGLISLRRYAAPLRELVTNLMREDNELVTDRTRVYLGDCHDHAQQVYDLIESYRDVATVLMDLYLSMMSQRMNEVMKVLTIMATLFIPLSFIAGLYGMNFDPQVSPWNMPELGWSFGYPLALGIMLAVAAAMLGYFWRKGWFR